MKLANTRYHLVWVTNLLLAAIGLIFPALVLGYNFFIVESMTYQFLYSLKNLYDYRWQQLSQNRKRLVLNYLSKLKNKT